MYYYFLFLKDQTKEGKTNEIKLIQLNDEASNSNAMPQIETMTFKMNLYESVDLYFLVISFPTAF